MRIQSTGVWLRILAGNPAIGNANAGTGGNLHFALSAINRDRARIGIIEGRLQFTCAAVAI